MNYVVFDLEWNQCPFGKERENDKLPFEIVEIGAVKIGSQGERLGEFQRIVRPMVYKKLHFRTKEVIHIDAKTLESGQPFYVVVKEFLEWCGENCVFCTWGTTDLVELQRNMKYYGLLKMLPGPIRFYDVQKLFSLAYEDGKTRKSLEYGSNFLKLEQQRDFHRALSDAWYTAEIFKGLLDKDVMQYYSIDCYQNPKVKEEQVYAVFDNYSKLIFREFESKEDAMRDREISAARCFLCDKNVRKKVKWFALSPKNHCCLAYCGKHGYLKGKIRMKRTEEGKFYVVKTMKLIDQEEAEEIKARREELKKKRREKRRQAKKNAGAAEK